MKRILVIAALLALLLPCTSVRAYDFSFFEGLFYQNSVDRYLIKISAPGLSTFYTDSYGSDLDPMLGLWAMPLGELLLFQDDAPDALSHGLTPRDAYFSIFLNPGTYLLTVSIWPNVNAGTSLSDGFVQDMDTPIWLLDEIDNPIYWVYMENVASADFYRPTPTPEPGTLLLLAAGGIGAAAVRRRRKNAA